MPIADTVVDPRSGVEGTVEIVTPVRSINAFLARPAEKPSSAVIVAHGGDGLNDETREYCCTLAAAGLLALAPDFGYRHDATLEKDAPICTVSSARRARFSSRTFKRWLCPFRWLVSAPAA
jgi:dienelactone hydrolase